jgi:hypothetical protein
MCFMRLNFNLYAIVWLYVAPYYATNHFEGAMIAAERRIPDDGIRVVPKHDGDLLTFDKYILCM